MQAYEYLSTVGEGAYGEVWKCRDKATGRIVAVKGFKQAHQDRDIMRLAVREAKVLETLDHPNVVKLLTAFRSKTGRVYMVFEFVGPSLHDQLDLQPTGLAPAATKLLAWQLLSGVAYLHDKKVLHRDIKPANVLLDPATGVAKLCDFGFARPTKCGPREVDKFTSYCVTRWYRAPGEWGRPKVLVSDHYGAGADVWSLGCTIAEMATGRALLPGHSTADQLWRIMSCLGPLAPLQAARMVANPSLAPYAAAPPAIRKTLRQRLPELEPRLLELVEACLRLDPRHRPTVRELLDMPYFWDVRRAAEGTLLASPNVVKEGSGSPHREAQPGPTPATAQPMASVPQAQAQPQAQPIPAPVAEAWGPGQAQQQPPKPAPGPSAPAAALPSHKRAAEGQTLSQPLPKLVAPSQPELGPRQPLPTQLTDAGSRGFTASALKQAAAAAEARRQAVANSSAVLVQQHQEEIAKHVHGTHGVYGRVSAPKDCTTAAAPVTSGTRGPVGVVGPGRTLAGPSAPSAQPVPPLQVPANLPSSNPAALVSPADTSSRQQQREAGAVVSVSALESSTGLRSSHAPDPWFARIDAGCSPPSSISHSAPRHTTSAITEAWDELATPVGAPELKHRPGFVPPHVRPGGAARAAAAAAGRRFGSVTNLPIMGPVVGSGARAQASERALFKRAGTLTEAKSGQMTEPGRGDSGASPANVRASSAASGSGRQAGGGGGAASTGGGLGRGLRSAAIRLLSLLPGSSSGREPSGGIAAAVPGSDGPSVHRGSANASTASERWAATAPLPRLQLAAVTSVAEEDEAEDADGQGSLGLAIRVLSANGDCASRENSMSGGCVLRKSCSQPDIGDAPAAQRTPSSTAGGERPPSALRLAATDAVAAVAITDSAAGGTGSGGRGLGGAVRQVSFTLLQGASLRVAAVAVSAAASAQPLAVAAATAGASSSHRGRMTRFGSSALSSSQVAVDSDAQWCASPPSASQNSSVFRGNGRSVQTAGASQLGSGPNCETAGSVRGASLVSVNRRAASGQIVPAPTGVEAALSVSGTAPSSGHGQAVGATATVTATPSPSTAAAASPSGSLAPVSVKAVTARDGSCVHVKMTPTGSPANTHSGSWAAQKFSTNATDAAARAGGDPAPSHLGSAPVVGAGRTDSAALRSTAAAVTAVAKMTGPDVPAPGNTDKGPVVDGSAVRKKKGVLKKMLAAAKAFRNGLKRFTSSE
ncbi:hypothetical protein HYH03_005357 [Edaphochlamys debaryana]|uniref:cyclin-dependent kinase n=1 Tax=Edaphochlamys debaryana TaxID=47281 RepID=A0A835Y5S9_9CHLO|nr:hypothetical protein HYH03_005357 [Edaphochlamys debaryana]|eukprot:KAG2496533.1 hypothetical protein HYH03_005357 [Edaphochlamys debaryana]